MTILPYTSAAQAHYEQLRLAKIRIGTHDLRIAAIALSVNGVVVTRNQRDFDRVPALLTQDWSIPV